MKVWLCIGLVAAIASSAPVADAGVSVQIGEPGFYGRVDIGGSPPPQVVYPQPVVIVPAPRGTAPEPIYLHVPPGHAKHWRKHCRKYNACDRPVYFVKDSWYRDEYVPRHQEGYGHWHEHGRHHGKD
jgi:hypothetical protein